jgi:hypothetical protein
MRIALPYIAATLLALACASGAAQAQTKQVKRKSGMVPVLVPVLNKTSGKLEAVLLLEPTTTSAGPRWRFGSTTLEATYGLQTGDSLALLCDRRNGIGSEIVQLANACVLASLDGDSVGNGSRHGTAGATLSRNGNKLGVAVGSGRDILPPWLSPNKLNNKVEQNDFSMFAEKNFGRDGFVSVGGTVARVRLVPAADVPQLADQWNTRSLSISAGIGAFGANIVGRVVTVPGESSVWKGLGLGLTWRTPWSGQLSVGADNVVTSGKNPFSGVAGQEQEGTVPYVRYQQDL